MHSWSQMMLTSRHSSTSRKIQTMSALWCRDKIDIMNSWAYLSPLLTNNNARLYRECVRPCVLCAQTCLTLRDPMNCGPPGSSVCGISQARILEWVAMPSSRGSSQPRDRTPDSSISYTAGTFLTSEPPGKAPIQRAH